MIVLFPPVLLDTSHPPFLVHARTGFLKTKQSLQPHLADARSVFLKMSQTSSTPGREAQLQPSNPRIYRAMSEEIDRLKVELERAQAREARLRQDSEAHQIFARQWQTRAEEAERELSNTGQLSRIQQRSGVLV